MYLYFYTYVRVLIIFTMIFNHCTYNLFQGYLYLLFIYIFTHLNPHLFSGETQMEFWGLYPAPFFIEEDGR